MKILERAVYKGPHFYSHTPMIRLQIDLESLEEWPTNYLPSFTERLLEALPGLELHGCCYRQAGGFVQRLHQGTWIGHVIEHVALELQSCAGSETTRGKTRSVHGAPGLYNVLYAYEEPEVGLMAGRLALQLVNALLPNHLQGLTGLDDVLGNMDVADIDTAEPAIHLLTRYLRRVGLGPTTKAIVDEAKRRGIPAVRLDDHSFVQLGTGRAQRRIRASITSCTSQIAADAAGDKHLTKTLLHDAGIPVPRGAVVRQFRDAQSFAQRLGYPLVVKPLDGNHGRGVTVNINDEDGLRSAFEEAKSHSRLVIIEQQLIGKDYRILVVDGVTVAVAERVPAHIIGNGQNSIRCLVDEANCDKRRGEGHETVMTKISIDDHVTRLLAKSGLSPESIPAADQMIYLRDTANMSTGGTAIDRTDDIHPENMIIAERAARAIGLDIAGIDFICPDISKPIRDRSCGIVEVNAGPGFRMHLNPTSGLGRNVARAVVEMLFPQGKAATIPIFAITGTNGKSTTVRMLAHILKAAGLRVGLTTTTGIYVDEHRIVEADASGPWSARLLLRDPTIDVVVLETARGGILREGLAFHECDFGAVTNVQKDHLGLRGIETLDDLAWVKSVVVEAVKPRGVSVLNADDPKVAAMAHRAGGRVCFFTLKSAEELAPEVKTHIERGGLSILRQSRPEGDYLIIHDDGEAVPVMRTAQIPATLGGLADFNVQNAMAAIALAFCHGVDMNTIRSAMCSYTSSFEHNPGRLNVHDGHGFRVILDYAHNPHGLHALGELINKMRPHYGRVIGMINIPGDRRDDDMREMGALATRYFDEIVFREDPARRGRKPGEIVALLTEGALSTGFPRSQIIQILEEDEAATHCLKMARQNDIVVLTPTDVEAMWHQVLAFKPSFPSVHIRSPLARGKTQASQRRRA